MSSSLRTLSSRAVGQYPLSVPTSLAIEGLADIHPELKPRRPATVTMADHLWVNVRTLYRNMMGSIENYKRGSVNPEDVTDMIRVEMRILSETVRSISAGKMDVTFYICSLTKLGTEFPYAFLMKDETEFQKYDAHHEINSLRPFYRAELPEGVATPGAEYHDVKVFHVYPRTQAGGRTMMLTNYPTDLLHRHDFAELYLLESRTGKVKDHTEFHTKLKTLPKGVQVPFNLFTLQVFGDTARIFSPFPKKARDLLLEVAEKQRWTVMTTKDRIRLGVSQIRDIPLQHLLNKIIRQ